MEKIDYEKLIDPILIPVIKYLREERSVDTRFCCQGSTEEDKHRHSIRGYICTIYSEEARKCLEEINKSHRSRYKSKHGSPIYTNRNKDGERVLVVYLTDRRWKSIKELEREWDLILSDLKNEKENPGT